MTSAERELLIRLLERLGFTSDRFGQNSAHNADAWMAGELLDRLRRP